MTEAKKSPKLPLTDAERAQLRKEKIKLVDIATMDADTLSHRLLISPERAKTMIALATFQKIPSVGPKMAQSVVDLGYYSLEELKDKDGAKLIEALEMLYGYWIDPCAEDVLRCIVHHANHPQSDKQWWDFTEERKAYRAKFGYPVTRPTKAWHE
jgi:hypothetical protein